MREWVLSNASYFQRSVNVASVQTIKDLVVAEIVASPAVQSEAEIAVELDRLQRLSLVDPLGSLDQVLSLM